MSLGIFVMVIIILIAAAVVVGVFYYGAKHDPHTSIRSVESSPAVQTLAFQAEATQKALEARQQAVAEATPKATGTAKKSGDDSDADDGPSPLGDEDAKAKRKAAALARKAARQSQQQTSQE